MQSKQSQYMRNYRVSLKLAALQTYSPNGVPCCACSKCPEHVKPHIEFLELDHIDGTGHEHRKRLGAKPGMRIRANRTVGGCSLANYKWLKDNNYPPGFQVLCKNCNGAKGTKTIAWRCPHEDD